MTRPEVFQSAFQAMTDSELVARWVKQQLSDVARPIAAEELRARGIEPDLIDLRGELDRQERDEVEFKRGQRQRAGRMSLRFVLTIAGAILSAFGAAVVALIFR